MKPRKKYSREDLQTAITEIKNGSSVYKISRKYNIPETTLRNKRDKKYCSEIVGRRTVLTKSEENKIVDWIHYLGRQGFPVSKEQLKMGVAKLVDNLNRPNTFRDGKPGKHWLANFLLRHPTVAKRVAQTLPTHRNKITQQDVRSWFDRVKSYFEKNNLLDILEDESRVYNCDETAFFLCPKEKDVLVKKGSKRVYNRVSNDEKECLTVLVNVSAGGNIAPPMVLYPYKRLPKHLPQTVPSTWGIGCTESGWMNMEAFYEYVTNVFYKWLLDNQITMPVALFMDGHTSHISLPLSLFCKEKGIILIALLPNSTHILQPLDVGVFRPVKAAWKKVVHEFRVKNNYDKLKRTDFAKQVEICFQKSLKVDTIKNSFKSAGIFPFDSNNIDYSKVIPQEFDTATPSVLQEPPTEQTNGFLQQFEKRLSPEVFSLFVESGSEWEGEEKYRCLFEFWKRIQEEVNQQSLIFNDTTIMNNIPDYDISDVVMDMEIRSNGSIILPLSPSIRANSVISQVDQQLTPPNKHFNRYLPDSSPSLQNKISSEHESEDVHLKLHPCDSQNKINKVYRAISRLSSSDCSLESMNPEEYIHNHNSTSQKSSMTTVDVHVDPKHCLKTLDPTSSRASSRQPSSDTSLEFFNSNKTNEGTVVECEGNLISTESVAHLNKNPTFPTPFKTAFYFPKSPNKNIKTRKTKKLTPTVAVADEFIEYQRRIAKERKEKTEGIVKRRAERLQKQKERIAQNRTSIQKKRYVKKSQKVVPKSCFDNPTTLEKIEEDQENEANQIENIVCSDNHTQTNPFSQRRIYSILDTESSSDDQAVILNVRKKASNVKKTCTKLFGESTSDSST